MAWTQTQTTCGTPITYTLYTSTGGTPATFVSLSASITFINVDTSSTGDVNTYNLEVIGNVGAYTTSAGIPFTLTVTNNCPTAIITGSSISP